MRKILFLFIFLHLCSISSAQVYREYLLSDWVFKSKGSKYWLPAQVPGILIEDLLDNGKSSIDSTDSVWFYKTTFIIDKQIMSRDFIQLAFEGLDTRATVFLNKKPILEANNMFRSWSVPIKSFVKEGENELLIWFTQVEYSPSLRKAFYHFGGQHPIPPLGVWRPIILESWDQYRLQNLSYKVDEISKNEAHLTAKLDFKTSQEYQLEVEIYDDISGRTMAREMIDVSPGQAQIGIPFTIKKPKLWWPKNLGKPNLYKIGVRVKSGENEQTMIKRIGIRDVRIDPSSSVDDLRLSINGQSVYVKKGLYWPMAMNASSVSTHEYDTFFSLFEKVERTVIHVQSPGIYEIPYFYDLADTHGILILQDFMFPPSDYPETASFHENIKAEVLENVKALQHHPSIVAWGGVVPEYPNTAESLQHINDILRETLKEVDSSYFLITK